MPAIIVAGPGLAGMSFRTDDVPRFPIDGEVVALEAGLLAGLPTEVAPSRAEHLHAELRLIRGEDIGVDVAGVDELAAGKPVVGGQVPVDRGEGGLVGGASWCR